MLSAFWAFIFSFSIFIAGVIAILRFRKINKAFYPFIFCIWIGCLNEILSFILFELRKSSPININIYVLLESLLLITLFKNLKIGDKPKYLFHILFFSLIVIWVIENFVLGHITKPGIYFRLIYYFIIVFMSLICINNLIASNKKSLLKNSVFLLCLGFILYYTFKVLIYSFWLYGLNSKDVFLLKVFAIMIYINLIANLIYALAIIWMPRKIEYTQQY